MISRFFAFVFLYSIRKDRIAIRSRSYAQRFPVPPWRYRLARLAELRLGDFNVQDLANTAWAFATASQQDAQLFAALARVAKLCLGELKVLKAQ